MNGDSFKLVSNVVNVSCQAMSTIAACDRAFTNFSTYTAVELGSSATRNAIDLLPAGNIYTPITGGTIAHIASAVNILTLAG
jgi:hypothetical protein